MKTRIVVAAHKPYPMPQDPVYLPVQAGSALHEPLGLTGDDSGENISKKNPNYCELTCLYWAWKNLDADVLKKYLNRLLLGMYNFFPLFY